MSPFQIYKIAQAIQVHFNTEAYDVFEKRGHLVGCTEESFLKKKSYVSLCKSLQRILKEPKDAVQFFVANCAYDTNMFELNIAHDSWRQWIKNKEMTTQLILDDLDQIGDIKSVLFGEDCKLMKLVSGKIINIETAVAINRKYNFADSWKHNFVYSKLGIKIKKLDRFVSFNESRIFEMMEELSQEVEHATA